MKNMIFEIMDRNKDDVETKRNDGWIWLVWRRWRHVYRSLDHDRVLGVGHFSCGAVFPLDQRSRRSTTHAPTHPRTPLDILKERYARGQIDEREYTQSKKALLK